MEIEQDSKVIVWFSDIEASQSTRKLYSAFLKLYCDCAKKTPSELIEEAIKEIKAGKIPAERKEVEYFAKFKDYLKSNGYADKSYMVAIASIRSFYKNYDIALPNGAVRTKKANPRRENQNFIQKSDIQNLLINAKNLREKAIILCMATSGMAIQEIINLRVNDIDIDSENIATIAIRRQKTGIDYTTFISPEAVKALQSYWEERNRDPSTAIKGNDFVFVSYHTGEKVSKIVLCHQFKFLGEELGYESDGTGKDGRKGIVKTRSHAMRKFFSSTLEDNGFPKPKIDFMTGHTVSETDKAYYNRNPDKLKELYKTYLPYLTFEKEIVVRSLDTEDAKKLSAMEEENKRLNQELQLQNTQHEEDIKAMQQKIEELGKTMAQLYKNLTSGVKPEDFTKKKL